MNLRQQLGELEGRERRAYPDPLTGGDPWTIGIGHTGPEVYRGLVWTEQQIDDAFAADIRKAQTQVVAALPWVVRLNEPRQAVVFGMAFQMGIRGLLGFTNTLAAMRDERWYLASAGMRASKWARQTPNRAKRLALQMESGEWN